MSFENVTFTMVTSNFTRASSHSLLITTSFSNSSVVLLSPSVLILEESVTSVRYSCKLDPGSYFARFQYCTPIPPLTIQARSANAPIPGIRATPPRSRSKSPNPGRAISKRTLSSSPRSFQRS